MDGFKERLRVARHESRVTQDQLGTALGVSKQAVSNWERGIDEPDIEKIRQMASIMGVSTDFLLGIEGVSSADLATVRPDLQTKGGAKSGRLDAFKPEITPGSDLVGNRDFPIYGAAQGGAAGHLIINFDPIQHVRRPAILEGVRGAYGIRVDGESMVPAFRPGDIALVHPHMLPEHDTDVVLFDHDPKTGDAEALIKHLTGFTDKQWKLEQYNPAKKFSEHRADWPICHRVVGRYDRRR